MKTLPLSPMRFKRCGECGCAEGKGANASGHSTACSKYDHRQSADVDPFLRGYLETALFTTDTDPPSGADYVESGRAAEMFPRLPEWFIEAARRDCAKFTVENAELLNRAADPWRNGSDFWYTRNGHGAGFWDRGYPNEVADPLTEACEKFGEYYLMPEDIGQMSED